MHSEVWHNALTVIGCDQMHFGLVNEDVMGMTSQVMVTWRGGHEMFKGRVLVT